MLLCALVVIELGQSVCVCLMSGILDVALCYCTCYFLLNAHSFPAADKHNFFSTGLKTFIFI